jgi:hypothetical protein
MNAPEHGFPVATARLSSVDRRLTRALTTQFGGIERWFVVSAVMILTATDLAAVERLGMRSG